MCLCVYFCLYIYIYICIFIHTDNIKSINFHFETLLKEQNKPKESRNKEIIKFRAEINEVEDRKLIKSVCPEVGSSKRVTTFYLHWPRKKMEKTQTIKIRNETGNINPDLAEKILKKGILWMTVGQQMSQVKWNGLIPIRNKL